MTKLDVFNLFYIFIVANESFIYVDKALYFAIKLKPQG